MPQVTANHSTFRSSPPRRDFQGGGPHPRDMTPHTPAMSVSATMLDTMTTVPLHRARASLTWLIERAALSPVTITRHGVPVAVVVSPDQVGEGGGPISSVVRGALRADLLHALALLDDSMWLCQLLVAPARQSGAAPLEAAL